MDFENKSLEKQFKDMIGQEHYKHYYQVNQFTRKYDITEKLRLYKTYGQFKCLELAQE